MNVTIRLIGDGVTLDWFKLVAEGIGLMDWQWIGIGLAVK